MKNLTMKTLAISTIASTFLLGATPDIGSVEKEIQVPKIEQEKVTIPKIKVKEYVAPMSDSGKTIKVNDFTITGNENVSLSELEQFYISFKEKELTFNQLQEIAVSITKYYRDKGYFVARAYIPAQDINANNNVLEIAIIEGNYGDIQLTNNSLVKDSIVQGLLDEAKSRSSIVSANSLERAMLIIQDTPGALITQADILPGKEVGSSDFQMVADASKAFDGYMVLDNSGSRYTGKNRLMIGANANSLLGYGDKLSFFGLISNGADLKNGKLSYSAPLMSNGLRAELSYSQTNYSLVEEYKSLDAKGTSKTTALEFTYPIIRTKAQNLYTSFTLANKDIKDEVDSTNTVTKKDTQSMKLAFDYDKSYAMFKMGSFSQASFTFTYGDLSFDDSADLVRDKNGANTNGNYSKVNLDLSNTLFITKELSLETSLRMQYALGNKNLDGSEDISIGGSSGVKLYPDGELSAENGYVFNIEAKYQLPTLNAYNHKIGIFYDAGRAYMADNKNVDFDDRSLQDIGLGYYASYKDFFGQIQAAWKVGSEDVTSEPDRNSRILFQAGWVF